jgi:hypothetical protein
MCGKNRPGPTLNSSTWNRKSFLLLQDTPVCPTIQEQVDPSKPFKDDYVTLDFETYVKVEGHYYNDSEPVGSTVNLTCLYDQC